MKRLFLSLSIICLFATTRLTAQNTDEYGFQFFTAPYTPLTNTTQLSDPTFPWDDELYPVPIGFDFTFLGKTYDTLYLDTYTFLMFGYNPNDETFESIYVGGYHDYADRGYKDTLNPVSLSQVNYVLEGTPGTRVLKIEFNNVGSYNDTTYTMDSYANLQFWLYEADNSIETRIGSNNFDNYLFDGDFTPVVGLFKVNANMEIGDNFMLEGDPNAPTTVLNSPTANDQPSMLSGMPTEGAVYRFAIVISSIGQPSQPFTFGLYPNPLTENQPLSLSNLPAGRLNVQIHDQMGRLVFEQENENHASQLALQAQLPKGLYHLSVNAAEKQSRQTFFVR